MLVVSLVSACSSVVNIDAHDSSSFTVFETSVVSQQDSLRLRLRGMQNDGEFTQSLPPGNQVRINDTSIAGPTSFTGSVRLEQWSLALALNSSGKRLLHGESQAHTYIGISQTRYDVSLDHAGSQYRTRDESTELYAQLEGVTAISDSIRLRLSLAYSLDGLLAFSQELDLGLDFALSPQFMIATGIRLFKYTDSYDDVNSDIEINLTGPYAGILLNF